ncbi:MAG TPA: protein kinase [Ignavibacteriales bacterium]|nr:protein kinase [Ignavibacteriales bacterium]
MIGKVINNYKIISELGQGGMGIVYKALDTRLDRYVAIKILKPQVVKNARFKERFEKEAKNQAKLLHQNIVPVFGYLEEEGLLGIIMEYVEGETLEHLIENRQRLDLSEALPIIKQVLMAAAYAHSKKFVHRDIKPSNIIINSEGVSKIMDFGISKSIVDKTLTSPGRNVGTLLYMSPEQIKGEEANIESDIYSIGITFFEMLAGAPPFNFETEQEITEGHLKKDPPDLLAVMPGLPAKIGSIIKKALSKKPSARFSTCQEFLFELEALEGDIPVFTGQEGPLRPGRNTQGYKFKAIFYSFLIVVSFLGIIYFSFTQVLELWKSGRNPLAPALAGKEKQAPLPGYSEEKLKSFRWNVLNSSLKDDLNSVFFTNDSTGFCCGSKGLILRTVNSGQSWQKIQTPVDRTLFDVAFTRSGVGFAVGEGGLVLRSGDQGLSWQRVDVRSTDVLLRVKFTSSSTGFILGAGGTVLRTPDEGDSWVRVDIPSENTLFDIDFLDASTGFIVGWNGECFRTLDKGFSWEKRPSFSSNYLRAVKFINSKTGFAAGGNGEVFMTDNSGQDWRKVKGSLNSGLSAIEFIDEKIGFIVGNQGKVLLTSDSGVNWSEARTNVFASLSRINLTPGRKVYAVGVNGTIVKF